VNDEDKPPPEAGEIRKGGVPLLPVKRFYRNVDTDLLMISLDLTEVVLSRNWDRIKGRNDWIAPLGVLIALIVAVLTTDFADVWLSAEEWRAVFGFATVLSVAWLLIELFKRFRRGRTYSPKDVLALLIEGAAVEDLSRIALGSSPTPMIEAGHDDLGNTPRSKQVAGIGRAGARVITPGPAAETNGTVGPPAGKDPSHTSGRRVEHDGFGPGTLVGSVQRGKHKFLEVEFDDPDVGRKRLREDLAPLRYLS
jgi:hypothetical protein